ncbi:MAG: DNA repair protein RadA [Simkaniaceae bacterium]
MAKVKNIWLCSECGHEQVKWTGSCSACGNWNTFQEFKEAPIKEVRFTSSGRSSKPTLLKDVPITGFDRMQTGISEVDRLLGGGAVMGSLTLIGGEPGVGKSTLLLELSRHFAGSGKTVLYISGEESSEQISLRARRMKIHSEKLYIYSEIQFSKVQAAVRSLSPDILIVDSVQMLYKEEVPSAPGSVTQVKEIAMECMQLAKGQGITTFLIGHVTKSGELAGPRVLEHIVDTVLEFEGDREQGFRLLRSGKNRFGPTEDIAIFQMEEEGLKQVENPSAVFLEERSQSVSGSVIIPTIEGSRAILVEAQALVAPSSFATSTRKSAGLSANRLALLLAVLEKRMGYQLHSMDVFVSIAGGIKITETALDLGIILAIASSFCNRFVPFTTVIIGEVGLGGEVRSVPRIEARLKEAMHMGFTTCVMPKKNVKGLAEGYFEKLHIHGIDVVEEAVDILLDSR